MSNRKKIRNPSLQINSLTVFNCEVLDCGIDSLVIPSHIKQVFCVRFQLSTLDRPLCCISTILELIVKKMVHVISDWQRGGNFIPP